MTPRFLFQLLLVLVTLLMAAGHALGNERHFTYTYETAVLPPGAREIEIWSTPRIGRENFFSRFDGRAEFEVGLTNRLQTSLYMNFESITQSSELDQDVHETEFEFAGISSEWKLKLLDPVADAFGLAAYLEVTGFTKEFELEGKIILDKRIGNALIAGNLVLEHEWEIEGDETEREIALEEDLAFAWFFTESFSAGIEVRHHSEFPAGEGLEDSVLFVGPVLAFSQPTWWVALTVLPQVLAFKESSPNSSLDLLGHERVNARLIFSFHL